MNRKLLLMAVAVTVTTAVHAQYVTYNHDSPKQNQVTVMETGTGALSPDLYYSVLHNKYKKSAAAKNKLSFRTLAGINLYNQVDEAEAIDSALVKRAKVEALNVADRQADIAWLARGAIRSADRWTGSGATSTVFSCPAVLRPTRNGGRNTTTSISCAINATKDAYMPNAQRKKEYLRIYEDVARQNEILVSYLAKRQNATATSTLLNATDNRTLHKGGIVRNAMSRWQESRLAVRGSQSGGNGNGEDDNESVNRGK